MEEEVERHQIIRDSSELEVQALRDRLLTVTIDGNSDSENSSERLAEGRLSRYEMPNLFYIKIFNCKVN